MARAHVCDCCGRLIEGRPQRLVMTPEGIHAPKPGSRADGVQFHYVAEVCESCRVSLEHHWYRLASGDI
jgi:hypothetical protein